MGKILNRKTLFICLLSFISLVCFSLLFSSTYLVRAEQDFLCLTNNEREYYSLSSPIDAYADDNVIAIVQGGSSQNLLVHTAQDGYRTMMECIQ